MALLALALTSCSPQSTPRSSSSSATASGVATTPQGIFLEAMGSGDGDLQPSNRHSLVIAIPTVSVDEFIKLLGDEAAKYPISRIDADIVGSADLDDLNAVRTAIADDATFDAPSEGSWVFCVGDESDSANVVTLARCDGPHDWGGSGRIELALGAGGLSTRMG